VAGALVGVCLKWVERRPEVDPLTGAVTGDARTSGASEADQAALEWALRMGDAWGAEVVAVTAGGPEAVAVLREALAVGADRAVRVDLPAGAPSEAVAAALAAALTGATAVVCGDWSLDRGSGSVPAYVAARLGAAQALGLVALEVAGEGAVRAERRLDGGRRERLEVAAPMVLSVEGRERLRRADLDGLLRAGDASIPVLPAARGAVRAAGADGAGSASGGEHLVATGPYRPRSRVLPPPAGASPRERILDLTGALVDRTPPEQVVLDPASAADRILSQLRTWGYLD
jgi:electron transfer flavoprotein beta subunit